MEMETDGSTLSCSSLIKLEEGIENFKRPVTPPPSAPPSTLRIQSTGKLTPLSPLKRNMNRTWKSPHITPLVFQQNATTNPLPQPNASSHERSSASASASVASSITRINSTGSSVQITKSDKSNSTNEHLIAPLKPMPPSPGRSNLKYWPNRRPSIEFTSSSSPPLPPPQGQLAQPFVHSAPPPRSISSDTSISARSSPTSPPESISLEGQETEELTTFDDSEDSAVGIMSTSSINAINDYRKESGDDETISRNTMTTIPGYSIDIVCSENLSSDAGDNGGEDFETIKWQVTIRKAKSSSTPLPRRQVLSRYLEEAQQYSLHTPHLVSIYHSLWIDHQVNSSSSRSLWRLRNKRLRIRERGRRVAYLAQRATRIVHWSPRRGRGLQVPYVPFLYQRINLPRSDLHSTRMIHSLNLLYHHHHLSRLRLLG